MRRIMGIITLVAVGSSPPVFAQTDHERDGIRDAETAEEATPPVAQDAQPQPAPTPLPPGLEKRGSLPHGLEKQGKTPRGWSQGKAWWKHPGQAAPASSPPRSHSPGARGGRGHGGHPPAHSHAGRSGR